jgi:predicted ABC-type ATPase
VPVPVAFLKHHDGRKPEGRLWMLTDAAGSGKTAIRDALRRSLSGVVVIDMDELRRAL